MKRLSSFTGHQPPPQHQQHQQPQSQQTGRSQSSPSRSRLGRPKTSGSCWETTSSRKSSTRTEHTDKHPIKGPLSHGVANPPASGPENLLLSDEDCIVKAAREIFWADALVIAAGAGFSADSGLPVYKDIADVAAYHKMGVTYADLCDPAWQRKDAEIFFGFWGSCFNGINMHIHTLESPAHCVLCPSIFFG
jgi:hypothetical protein